MRDAPAPGGPAPAAVRSIAACLATILDLDPTEVPVPAAGDPWLVWREWLAGRGLGLVRAADGAALGWAGPSLATLADGRGVVRFGVPPGIAWDPLGGPAAEVAEAWVVAALDPRVGVPAGRGRSAGSGTVEAIVVAPAAGAPARLVERAPAVAGRGLEGDRYFDAEGTFSAREGLGQALTLVEAEALEAAGVSAVEARRNVVVRGLDLDGLIGREFRVGAVLCRGQRRCEPCAHLERLTRPGVLRALVHRGGLRADVLADGEIARGDPCLPSRD